jgi:VRR-NUC domain
MTRRKFVWPADAGPTEQQIHLAVVQLLLIAEAMGKLTFCHVPNGFLSKSACLAARGMGLRAGVPDLLIWLPGKRLLMVELKSRIGELSDAQAAWHARARVLGHDVQICRSVDEVERLLASEGVVIHSPPSGGRVMASCGGGR